MTPPEPANSLTKKEPLVQFFPACFGIGPLASLAQRVQVGVVVGTLPFVPLQVGIKLIGDSASAFGPPFRLLALHSDFMLVDREKCPETMVRYDGIAALTIP